MDYRYVDQCSCRQGLVLVVRDKITNKLMLICDDCGYMWLTPQAFYENESPLPDDIEVDFDFNVSDEEIFIVNWTKYVKNTDT